jgi:hypothetical protein
MSLIATQVDSNFIKLHGWWQSDVMLEYLHVMATPVLQNFAQASYVPAWQV